MLARTFLNQVATGLGISARKFASIVTGCPQATKVSSLEAIQYLPPDLSSPIETAGCEAHVDKGLLTCIFADQPRGLQASCRLITLPVAY